MERERVILHIDINHCYAQIEEMKYPELKEVPMAVGGSEASRHGIILARNLLAKKFGVTTADTLRDALKKCPDLLIVPPNMKEYLYYTHQVKSIFKDYSDEIESFGVDEAWVDVTSSIRLFGPGVEIAKEIQQRILDEVGLTVSIGVSFNKIFAKLGSDMIKPSGLVEISRDNYKKVVWPLPVEDLLYVGRSTKAKLNSLGVFTIGDLANMPLHRVAAYLNKPGATIWSFANGYDESVVKHQGYQSDVKSVGNSTTLPKDVNTYEEAKIVLQVLAESVASRLKDNHQKGNVISLYVRDNKLSGISRQVKIDAHTDLSTEIRDYAYKLLLFNYDFERPIRSIGISVSGLSNKIENNYIQMDFFSNNEKKVRERIIDQVMDAIRNKYTFSSIKKASVMLDQELTAFNPKGDHTVHPTSFFK